MQSPEDDKAFLKVDLPDRVARLAWDTFGSADDLKISMPSDMLPDGSYGETWLVVSSERLGVIRGTPLMKLANSQSVRESAVPL